MRRRHFVRALVAAPAVPAVLVAQQQPQGQPAPGIPPNPTTPVQPPNRASEEIPRLDVAIADQAAGTTPHYFTPAELAALRRLSDILMPARQSVPGALAVGAPEFLDFLISQSPAERQQLYRGGLDALNAASRKRFNKTFAGVDDAQASELLTPLHQPWTYDPPLDPLARFLVAAKLDIRTATMNSREFSAQAVRGGNRRYGGTGLYWYPLD